MTELLSNLQLELGEGTSEVKTEYYSDNSASLPGISGSGGPVGFEPGMFNKQDIAKVSYHCRVCTWKQKNNTVNFPFSSLNNKMIVFFSLVQLKKKKKDRKRHKHKHKHKHEHKHKDGKERKEVGKSRVKEETLSSVSSSPSPPPRPGSHNREFSF